jgi:lysozyme family protein
MAADFNKAIPFTRMHEGGYSNIAGDNGGETYCGIARVDNPEWEGWTIVDAHKPLKYNERIQDLTIEGMVNAFYKAQYWNKISGDGINNQQVAAFLFDWYVNSEHSAVRELQRIVGAPQTGNVGPITLPAINFYKGNLFEKLKAARIAFYNQLAANNAHDRQFLDGWIDRVNDFA